MSGGGVPCGLENSVARFIDTEKEQRRRIDELSQYKCDVTKMINSLKEEIGGTMLRYEYLLGMSAKQAYSVFENQFNERQAMRYKEKALIEIAKTEEGKKVISVYSHEGYQPAKDADYDNEAKAQEIVKKLK